MPIIDTKHLFEKVKDREKLVYPVIQPIFPNAPPEAIQYELLQQGLLQSGELRLSLDAWQILKQQLEQLMHAWDGPDAPIYILPIKNGFVKNGVAYPNGVCLFISERITMKELHALFAHEYHHMCRRRFIVEPPTLMDSIIMEGLAEMAVESLFGEHALSSWTKRYSLAEVKSYWHSHFINSLGVKGLQNHQPFLFGDNQLNLPPWIGYCLGYRIVEAFQLKNGPISQKQLLQLRSEEIVEGAGF